MCNNQQYPPLFIVSGVGEDQHLEGYPRGREEGGLQSVTKQPLGRKQKMFSGDTDHLGIMSMLYSSMLTTHADAFSRP
jgi:hypothetical protein